MGFFKNFADWLVGRNLNSSFMDGKQVIAHLDEFEKDDGRLPTLADLETKLDKDTSVTSYRQVYAKNKNGAQSVFVVIDQTPIANALPLYSGRRTLFTLTPDYENDCANKGYVDSNFQGKLYIHEGVVTVDGNSKGYKVISKKSTAFTNPETDFTEHGNVFTLRTGPQVLFNLWYDDSDGTYYYTDIGNTGTEISASAVTIAIDSVYEL